MDSPHSYLSDVTLFAVETAREAADLVMAVLPESRAGKEVRHKSPTELVTRADYESEQLIVERIRERFPTHGILGEESATGGGESTAAVPGAAGIRGPAVHDAESRPSAPRWIIDPVDGTANFAHGVPWFGISIAFEDRRILQCGVVAVPPLREFFVAERGRGAYLFDGDGAVRRLIPSATSQLEHALVSTGLPRKPARASHVPSIGLMMMRSLEVRVMGAAAIHLAYVAAGRLDAYWEPSLSPWDVAAGIVLVEEAGGRVTDLAGQPLRTVGGDLLASNGRIHDEMVELLRHGS